MLNEEIAEALDAPYNAAFEQGVQDERAAIVAWLRAPYEGMEDERLGPVRSASSLIHSSLVLRRVATIIERGGHKEKER